MPAVTRLGDLTTGHPNGFPPRPSTSASHNVFASGKQVVRANDSYAPHSNGSSSHSGTAVAGQSKKFVNGRPVIRVGDPVSCGDTVAQGSSKVFVG